MHNFNLKTDKKITQLEVSVKLYRRGHRGSDCMVVGLFNIKLKPANTEKPSWIEQ
jgi:hypothetical protein